MKYGYFDKEKKEYVITRPDTPLPWINYLGCEEYCALISNTAGGYSFYKDPKERRILRYRYNNIPYDRGGRYLYLRDNKSGIFWSATWQPVIMPTAKWSENGNSLFSIPEGKKEDYIYECRHGLGYTKITSIYNGIHTITTYFVPLKENCEVWMMEIKNNSLQDRDLSIFSFVEFCLWDALNDMTDYQYNLNIGETAVEESIIYHLSRYRVERKYFAYFSVNQKIEGYDTQREDFLGRYGDLSSPRAVREGKSNNSIACGWAPVGSHNVRVHLKSGETKVLIFVLGYSEDKNDVKRVVQKFSTKENTLKELENLKNAWDENLSKLWVNTPDEDVNLMVNVWNQYQCRTTFNWSRSASYYESGIGRGMGFRDSNQDTMGFVYQIPDKVRERIIDLASTQFERGDARHQYSPLTKKGNGEGYSDDHLWLVYSVASYIKETGDIKFLSHKVPYEGGKKKGTIYEHLQKAINFSLKNVGPHKLPLAGFADWNDCLNMLGPNKQAESVMVAQMLAGACLEMSKMASLAGKKSDAVKYEKLYKKVKDQINKVAWDGEWYIRAFDDNKKPVGSKKNKEGKIFLETQGWAILAQVADKDRAIKCLDSVKKHLATKYGIMILQPSFSKFYPELGSISIYPPGLKENGAIFCHPNPWIIIAECMVGRGDQAFEYYKAIAPSEKNKIPDIHKLEPYVYCQMIAGKDHKDFGEGKNSWLTGSAAWNFIAISQWILGIRADYEGLRIDPCIPSSWDGFEAKRTFRGCEYHIKVFNPNKVNKGIISMKVDGKEIEGNLIPYVKSRKQCFVEVVMG